jgi:hypothetical protein
MERYGLKKIINVNLSSLKPPKLRNKIKNANN